MTMMMATHVEEEEGLDDFVNITLQGTYLDGFLRFVSDAEVEPIIPYFHIDGPCSERFRAFLKGI